MEKREAKFLVDRTAGKLGRWLRILGFDVEYVPTCEVAEITRRARISRRVALTRTKAVAQRLGEGAILLESDSLEQQIRQILRIYGWESCNPFSRCSVCNTELVTVDKEAVKGRVPEYVYQNHNEFSVCTTCGRYYWRGTHWQEMSRKINDLINL